MKKIFKQIENLFGVLLIMMSLNPSFEEISQLDKVCDVIWFICGVAFCIPWKTTKKYLSSSTEITIFITLSFVTIICHLMILYQNRGYFSVSVLWFSIGYIVLLLSQYFRYKTNNL